MGINHQPTPGYPTHYIEWHTCLSLAFQAHLVSLLTEGVFERFPSFKVVLSRAAWPGCRRCCGGWTQYWKALRTRCRG